MAINNPRKDVNLNELGADYASFLTDGSTITTNSVQTYYPATTSSQIGQSVSIASNRTIKVGAAGDPLLGKLAFVSQGDGVATVQWKGFATFSYVANSTAPVLKRGVVCDGAGGVSIAASGSEYTERGIVVDKDTTNLLVTVLLQ